MSPRFRRLSAPGASALSSWRLDATAPQLLRSFGVRLAPDGRPRHVRVGPPDAPFDEGLLLTDAHGAELHLHGGTGTASALRAWLGSAGWSEEPPVAAPLEASTLPGAAEARSRFLHADSPLAARAWSAFAAQGGGPGLLAALARLEPAARRARARELLAASAWADLLTAPPLLVLAGPANAGKSSLFNAWLGAHRATVADAPGTTRDAVGELLQLGAGTEAWTVRLLDTAGLWDAAAGVDADAVARAETALGAAWRRIWIFDAAHPPEARARRALERADPRDLRLLHRTDLGETWEPESVLGGDWLRGSLHREGPALIARLEAALLTPLGPPPAPGAVLPFGTELRARLAAAAEPGDE